MNFCFYHKADFDGKCSGALIKLNDLTVKLIGIDYGMKFPFETIHKDDTVIMVDFSLEKNDMDRLNKMCNFIWIDHHISVIKETKDLNIKGIRRTNMAGCGLTWEYFFKGQMPQFVKYLSDFDIHNLQDINTEYFQYGMNNFEDTNPDNVMFWRSLFNEEIILSIIEKGKLIHHYKKIENKKIMENSFEVNFEDYRGLVINTSIRNINMFDSIWDESKYDLMIYIFYRDKKWKILVGTTKDIDVSKIARKFGGGGHKRMAGFICDKLPF